MKHTIRMKHIYDAYRWYDSLAKDHASLRFILFMSVAGSLYMWIAISQTFEQMAIPIALLAFFGITRFFYLVRSK